MSPFVNGNIVYISVSLMVNRKFICEGESVLSPNHTQLHTTARRTPLDEGSAGRRDLYFYKQRSQETDIHGPLPWNSNPQSQQGCRRMTTAWIGLRLSFEE
jgi:hypothetical protein